MDFEIYVRDEPNIAGQKLAAQFAAPDSTEVVRTGKCFEVGSYPSHQFSLTETESDEAIAEFNPVSLTVEHKASIFDGQLGKLRKVWRQGKELFAEFSIPKWLHELTGGNPLRLSMEWSRGVKRVVGCSIVLDPQIKDAVMMSAAFSTLNSLDAEFKKTGHKTQEHQYVLQRIHNMTAGAGAICVDTSKPSTHASKHEMTAMQMMHDISLQHGAACTTLTEKNVPYDIWSEPAVKPKETVELSKPSMWDRFVGFIVASGEPVPDKSEFAAIVPPAGAPVVPPAANPEVDQLKAELAEFKAKAASDAKAIEDAKVAEAAQFAALNREAVVAFAKAGKIDPADIDVLAADRAKAPVVFDALMARMPVKPEYQEKIPTITGEQAEQNSRSAPGTPDEKTKFETQANALYNSGICVKL